LDLWVADRPELPGGRSSGTVDWTYGSRTDPNFQAPAAHQALCRLERRGIVVSEWGVTEHGRRARYYELAREGHRELLEQTSQWVRYATTLTDILPAEAGPA
jgi:hypothetical protein